MSANGPWTVFLFLGWETNSKVRNELWIWAFKSKWKKCHLNGQENWTFDLQIPWLLSQMTYWVRLLATRWILLWSWCHDMLKCQKGSCLDHLPINTHVTTLELKGSLCDMLKCPLKTHFSCIHSGKITSIKIWCMLSFFLLLCNYVNNTTSGMILKKSCCQSLVLVVYYYAMNLLLLARQGSLISAVY